MQGGAVTLAREFVAGGIRPSLLLVTDMLDLTTFLALTRPFTSHLPVVLYLHENQLTYPLPADGTTGPMRRQLGERDLHYALINFTAMLAADEIWFNSHYHRETLLAALPGMLHHFPEYQELETLPGLAAKSRVMPVGVAFGRLATAESPGDTSPIPLILWNQRWEYDKNPALFVRVLAELAAEGVAFRVALCGEQFGKRSRLLDEAQTRLGERIVHVGYAEADVYRRWLWEATITVSTAEHEFFGISLLEAIYCHTFPVLPNRLSYPELIPEAYWAACLYEDSAGLLARLRWALTYPAAARRMAGELATAVSRYDWSWVAPLYDAQMRQMISSRASVSLALRGD